MASVYLATDVLLHRPVAIKMLHDRFAGDREFVERFRREAQAAASLSHPNVVNLYDVGEDEGTHYIVLEYVRGRNLKDILRRSGPLPIRQAVFVSRAVASALDAAHRRGLIHRDIKPHNILITDEGRVKVTDFGIARAASAATLTQTGTLIGSVHYFSPEQARGELTGPESDIYSLGVVLYEMLTGRLPFTGDTPISVALKHLQEHPPPPSRFRINLAPSLEAIIMKALAKKPQERYRTPAEMLLDLRQFSRHYREEGEDEPHLESSSITSLGTKATVSAQGAGDRAFSSPSWWQQPAADKSSPRTSKGDASEQPTQVMVGRARSEGSSRSTPSSSFEQTWKVSEEAGRARSGDSALAEQEGVDEADMSPVRQRRRGRRMVFWLLLVLSAYLGVTQGAPRLTEWIFPPDVRVPNVISLHLEEAREVLAEQGLELIVERRVHHPEVPEFHVIAQNPDPQRNVRMGRTIHVAMSLGPDIGPVPDVVGISEREARLTVTQQGFTLGEVHEELREDVPLNTVLAQHPDPGENWERGRPIDLWVARQTLRAPRIALPDFRGSPIAEVQQQLIQLGLREGNLWPEQSALLPPGRIIDQNPAPEAEVEVGSTVDFVYSAPMMAEDAPGRDPIESQPPHEADSQPASAPTSGARRQRTVSVYVPEGPVQEVVIVVIDDFGAREIFRDTLRGGSRIEHSAEGRGRGARVQVYMGGSMVMDAPLDDN